MKLLSNPPKPFLHVFVCINDRSNRNSNLPSCAPEIDQNTVRNVKAWIIQNQLIHKVLITKTKCLGICPENGGVMVIYKKNKQNGIWYNNIQDENDIVQAIKQELVN